MNVIWRYKIYNPQWKLWALPLYLHHLTDAMGVGAMGMVLARKRFVNIEYHFCNSQLHFPSCLSCGGLSTLHNVFNMCILRCALIKVTNLQRWIPLVKIYPILPLNMKSSSNYRIALKLNILFLVQVTTKNISTWDIARTAYPGRSTSEALQRS